MSEEQLILKVMSQFEAYKKELLSKPLESATCISVSSTIYDKFIREGDPMQLCADFVITQQFAKSLIQENDRLRIAIEFMAENQLKN